MISIGKILGILLGCFIMTIIFNNLNILYAGMIVSFIIVMITITMAQLNGVGE